MFILPRPWKFSTRKKIYISQANSKSVQFILNRVSIRVLSTRQGNLRMSSIIPLVSTTIHCGGRNVTTIAFNDQSSIDQIHGQVRVLCGTHLPNDYCLMFYHVHLKKFVPLNQRYLFGESNVFRLNSSIIAHNENHVDLWVIDMANENDTSSGT